VRLERAHHASEDRRIALSEERGRLPGG
jgi:hypothetical protein